MRLTVLPRPDQPAASAISAVFQAPGGTLGRSPDTDLPLPDADRSVCRVQAAVRISHGACYLVNLSSMGAVSINGRAIGRDQEVPLAPGDELVIGPYRIQAEDPTAVAAAAVAAAAAPAAVLAEPDPLLESPLLDDAELAPAAAYASHQAAPPAIPPAPAAAPASGPVAAAEPTPAPVAAEAAPAAQAPAEQTSAPPLDTITTVQESDSRSVSDSPKAPDTPTAPAPSAAFPDAAPTGFASAGQLPQAPLDDLDLPLAAEPAPPADAASDPFSDLFGPGTLPVGSVPDVSAHPFDLESAQVRNPEDPLRQLPRGDANVRGPLRDPLDALGDNAEGAHNVFSDSTPSTLPSHDPLAGHRSDPVTDTLTPRQQDDDARAARDHLREYGAYLRPARVRQEDPADPSGKPPRK
ncbi:FHA domain-containing protein [Bordetella petrii]|uniref:FHA domain-containing protein n=1 Tax=Bordetella petrii TaxID=94624 RepID=UPI0004792C30|nr:FHA domain-containing protein [Bordetella petrii]